MAPPLTLYLLTLNFAVTTKMAALNGDSPSGDDVPRDNVGYCYLWEAPDNDL